jgi:hypothetical protein
MPQRSIGEMRICVAPLGPGAGLRRYVSAKWWRRKGA